MDANLPKKVILPVFVVELSGSGEAVSKSTCSLPAIQWDPSALAKLQGLPLPPVLTPNQAAQLFDPQQFAQLSDQTRTNYTIQQVSSQHDYVKLNIAYYKHRCTIVPHWKFSGWGSFNYTLNKDLTSCTSDAKFGVVHLLPTHTKNMEHV